MEMEWGTIFTIIKFMARWLPLFFSFHRNKSRTNVSSSMIPFAFFTHRYTIYVGDEQAISYDNINTKVILNMFFSAGIINVCNVILYRNTYLLPNTELGTIRILCEYSYVNFIRTFPWHTLNYMCMGTRMLSYV